MTSVLADAPFRQFTLSYRVFGDEPTDTDEFGNPVFPEEVKALTALLGPFKRTQLERQEGTDPKLLQVRGELIQPLSFPPEVFVGSALELDFEGRPYKLTLTNVIPNDLEGVDFGAYFEGEMTPQEVEAS